MIITKIHTVLVQMFGASVSKIIREGDAVEVFVRSDPGLGTVRVEWVGSLREYMVTRATDDRPADVLWTTDADVFSVIEKAVRGLMPLSV